MANTKAEKCRVVILANESLFYHQYLSLLKIIESPGIEVAAIFVNTAEASLVHEFRKHLKKHGLARTLIRTCNQLTPFTHVLELEGSSKSMREVSVRELGKGLEGDILRTADLYSRETLEKLESYAPEVIFRYGFGIIKGKVLSIPPKGVIGYHHGDLEKYRGMYPCVWEMYNGESEVGVTIQKLSKGLDSGEIILQKSYNINTGEGINQLIDRVYLESTCLGADAILKLNAPGFKAKKPKKLGKYYSVPSACQWLRLHLINLSRKLGYCTTSAGEASP